MSKLPPFSLPELSLRPSELPNELPSFKGLAAAGLCGRRGRRGRAYEPTMNTTDLAPGKSGGLYGGLHTRDAET